MFDIAVVIPTQGRPSIIQALESLTSEAQRGYKPTVIVVEDTFGGKPDGYYSTNDLRDVCKNYRALHLSYNSGYHDWGYPQLDYAYRYSVGRSEFIMNIGDDDVMVEGAIPDMLQIISHYGMIPYLFQAELHPSPHRGNTVPMPLWNDYDRSITRGKVTGQNFVVPNIPALFGNMVDDFEFIRSTIERWHGTVKWVPLVTCRCY
jgi:hypothetical protein